MRSNSINWSQKLSQFKKAKLKLITWVYKLCKIRNYHNLELWMCDP